MSVVTALPQKPTVRMGAADRAIGRLANIELMRPPDGAAQADLAGDIFHEMYQMEPAALEEIPPERQTNRALLDWMRDTHGWEKSRTSTKANLPASMVSSALMWAHLNKDEVLKEALKKQEEAERAADEAAEQSALAETLRTVADIQGDPDLARAAQAAAAAADKARAKANQAAADALQIVQEAQGSPRKQAEMAAAATDAARKSKRVAKAMAGWGMGPGDVINSDPAAALEFLKKNQGDIEKIAELAGRMRGFALQARQERAPQGIIPTAVGQTPVITHLFPTELAMLRPDAPEHVRAAKWAQLMEVGLLGYQPAGNKEKRGPFVAATDVSPSMRGLRNIVAKAVALGVGQVARMDGRPYTLFAFASDEAKARRSMVTSKDGWPKHLSWAGMMHSGGTDFNMSLKIAMEHLEAMEQGGHNADLLWISDGEAGVSPDVASDWKAFKERTGARLFYVPVARGYRPYGNYLAIQDVADKTVALGEIDENAGTQLAAELGRWL